MNKRPLCSRAIPPLTLTSPIHTLSRTARQLATGGAHQQAAALADRAAAHATLSAPNSIAQLLENPQHAGASKQAALLLNTLLPAEGLSNCSASSEQLTVI